MSVPRLWSPAEGFSRHPGVASRPLVLLLLLFSSGAAGAAPSTADHHDFEQLRKDFATGPEVTRACLGCHTEAAGQIQETIHWTWSFSHPETGQQLGKRHLVNNFCLAIASNWPRCTSCHVGYGWRDRSFDFSAAEKVDCLVCHDGTGNYEKFPTAAGHPPYEPRRFPPGSGELWQPPDLARIARSVTEPDLRHCGACHFYGGGADGAKHGHLDSSLLDAPVSLDVHMSAQGGDFACQSCHTAGGHQIAGSRYHFQPSDPEGREPASCESCHGSGPHARLGVGRLNRHAEVLACTACHVPEFARGGVATKVWWDWSTAGRLDAAGEPYVERNEQGKPVYATKKGTLRWAENVVPDYAWYDGNIVYTLPGEPIDPESTVQLNRIAGDRSAPRARIWPFKTMRGRQPYDAERDVLLLTHLFGNDNDAFWRSFDWGDALQAGAESRDLPYSGEYDFVETAFHWPVTHMVAPADASVSCESCHRRGGRLAGVEQVYIPAEDRVAMVDGVGMLLVMASLGGVALHGGARFVAARRRSG